MNRIDELTLAMLDDELADSQVRELIELLDDEQVAQLSLTLFQLEGFLNSPCTESVANRVIGRIESDRQRRIEKKVMATLSGPSEKRRIGDRFLQRRKWTVLFALATSIVVLVSAFALFKSAGREERPILVAYSSNVQYGDTLGSMQAVELGKEVTLEYGQSIATDGSTDAAEIIFDDGTRVALRGDTHLTVELAKGGAKKLTIRQGGIHAVVARQPRSSPLIVATPKALLTVLGTTLDVDATNASTHLEVSSGRVAMVRSVDGARVEVEGGEYVRATAIESDDFAPKRFPLLSDDWLVDFSVGLPDGWLSGELISTNEGSAVQATPDGRGEEKNFAVTTENAWREGRHAHFMIHEDSVLWIRFRQQEIAPIRVMVASRKFPPRTGQYGYNLFYADSNWQDELHPDAWQTIAIPLKNVSFHGKQGNTHDGRPELQDLAAYIVQVTTMTENVGLAVDRMWVTRANRENGQ